MVYKTVLAQNRPKRVKQRENYINFLFLGTAEIVLIVLEEFQNRCMFKIEYRFKYFPFSRVGDYL